MRENFSIEEQIRDAVVPLPDKSFLEGLISREDVKKIKSEEEDLVRQLQITKEYERIFSGSVPLKQKEGKGKKIQLDFVKLKGKIIGELKDRLAQVDRGEDYEEAERSKRKSVYFESESGRLFVDSAGEKQYITEEDIVADYDWGIKYRPDLNMPKSVWRRLRKISDINEAKAKVSDIFDLELRRVYGADFHDSSVEQLEKLMGMAKNEQRSRLLKGFLTERMVFGLLTRVSADLSGDKMFEVEKVNLLEDSEYKYDFKITKFNNRAKGVVCDGLDLRGGLPPERIGVQLTYATYPGILEKKANDVESAKTKIFSDNYRKLVKNRVEDIVLVSINLEELTSCFSQWLKGGKPGGGPEQFLTKGEKINILSQVFSSLPGVSNEDLSDMVGVIRRRLA